MLYCTAQEELSAVFGAADLGPDVGSAQIEASDSAVFRAVAGAVIAELIESGQLELVRRDMAVRRLWDGDAQSGIEQFVLNKLPLGRPTGLRRLVGWTEMALADGTAKYADSPPGSPIVARLVSVVGGGGSTPRDCLLLALLHGVRCDAPVLGPQLPGLSDRRLRSACRRAGRSDPLSRAMLVAMEERGALGWLGASFDLAVDLVT